MLLACGMALIWSQVFAVRPSTDLIGAGVALTGIAGGLQAVKLGGSGGTGSSPSSPPPPPSALPSTSSPEAADER
jgi:hypothetical protein